MSFWQELKSKFSKKQELPQVPTMEAINQQNADLTQKEQSVETLLNTPPAPSLESQVMPAPEVPVTAEPAPITTAPVKKSAPKKSVAKKVVKKAAPKKAVKKVVKMPKTKVFGHAQKSKISDKAAPKKPAKKAASKKKR